MIKYDQWYYFPTKRDKEKFLEKVIPELYFYMSKEKWDELFILFMEKELIRIAPDKTLRFRTNRSSRYDEEMGVIAYKDTIDSTLEKEENNNQENSKMAEVKTCSCSNNFKTPAFNLVQIAKKKAMEEVEVKYAAEIDKYISNTTIGKILTEAAKTISKNLESPISWKNLFELYYLPKEEVQKVQELGEKKTSELNELASYYMEIEVLLSMAECYDQIEKILKEYKLLQGPKK